ncbi:hypothetical protein GCM10023080_073960 [Streptomyces pseudoechinosporeus]
MRRCATTVAGTVPDRRISASGEGRLAGNTGTHRRLEKPAVLLPLPDEALNASVRDGTMDRAVVALDRQQQRGLTTCLSREDMVLVASSDRVLPARRRTAKSTSPR